MSTIESQHKPSPVSEAKGQEPDMVTFRAEIAALIAERAIPSLFLDGVDITLNDLNDLNVVDAEIWNKIKNYEKEPLARRDYFAYIEDVEKLKNGSRRVFAQFIGGKFQTILGNEEIERRKTARMKPDDMDAFRKEKSE